jgi:anti-sigma B factor antagonist
MAAPDVTPATAAVVSMPGEIDAANAADVEALITAALAPGITVVIADLTATRFCDSSGLQQLLLAHRRAAAAGAQLRLAVLPGGPVSRVVELTGINRHVPVYPALKLAIDSPRHPADLPPAGRGDAG